MTGGEKGDASHFAILLGHGPDVDPRAAVADKGYASKAKRQAARSRGIVPVIPRKANEKGKPGFFAKSIYKGRPSIEQAVGKLERVSLPCEKMKRNFPAIVALAAGFILIKSAHAAQAGILQYLPFSSTPVYTKLIFVFSKILLNIFVQ